MRIASFPAAYTQEITGQKPDVSKTGSSSFGDMLKEKIGEVDNLQHQSDEAMSEGAVEGAKHIDQTMIKLDEADLSLRLMTKVRTKALEAYQEIMRMQF